MLVNDSRDRFNVEGKKHVKDSESVGYILLALLACMFQ